MVSAVVMAKGRTRTTSRDELQMDGGDDDGRAITNAHRYRLMGKTAGRQAGPDQAQQGRTAPVVVKVGR